MKEIKFFEKTHFTITADNDTTITDVLSYTSDSKFREHQNTITPTQSNINNSISEPIA